jgi:cytochrome c oxidase subunit IV
MAEHVVPRRVYILVGITLLCLTAVTAWVSWIDLGGWSAPVAILIATIKASLVVLFFMHIRYERQAMVYIWLCAGLFWFIILLLLSMTDYGTRGFLGIPGR